MELFSRAPFRHLVKRMLMGRCDPVLQAADLEWSSLGDIPRQFVF
jgi:hypothetical protein